MGRQTLPVVFPQLRSPRGCKPRELDDHPSALQVKGGRMIPLVPHITPTGLEQMRLCRWLGMSVRAQADQWTVPTSSFAETPLLSQRFNSDLSFNSPTSTEAQIYTSDQDLKVHLLPYALLSEKTGWLALLLHILHVLMNKSNTGVIHVTT